MKQFALILHFSQGLLQEHGGPGGVPRQLPWSFAGRNRVSLRPLLREHRLGHSDLGGETAQVVSNRSSWQLRGGLPELMCLMKKPPWWP